MSYQRHSLKEHVRHSVDEYVKCVEQAPRGLSKLQPDTVHAMLGLIPVKASSYYQSHLLLANGEAVTVHDHPEWVALFYVDPGDPPHPIVIEGERVIPEAGDVVVMPPGVSHYVDAYNGKRPRILFAVLVEAWE